MILESRSGQPYETAPRHQTGFVNKKGIAINLLSIGVGQIRFRGDVLIATAVAIFGRTESIDGPGPS